MFEELKNDKEFLKRLKEREKEALKNSDIIGMYDVLDSYLALDIEADKIDLLYQKILEEAFEKLGDMLVEGRGFDFSKEYDRYIARAIYEHALERWDSGDFRGANELFLILSYMVDESLKKGMLLALGLTAKKVGLDEFINEYVDKEFLDEDSFFFDKFTLKAEEFLQKNKDLIEKELEKIKKIATQ